MKTMSPASGTIPGVSPTPHPADSILVVLSRRPETRIPARYAGHLERCARCRAVLSAFRRLREHLAQPASVPGRAALARVFALAEPHPPAGAAAAKYPVARLVLDSGPVLQVAGMRAAGTLRAQLWQLPGADVDVRVEPVGLGTPGLLHGQVFPHRPHERRAGDGSVWLVQRGRRAAWAPIVESGEFELPAPTHRRWSLWLEWCGVRARLETS